MRKILLVCDRKNWAYDAIARNLLRYNEGLFEFDVLYIKQEEEQLRERAAKFDFVFFLGWQLILKKKKGWFGGTKFSKVYPFIEDSRILTGIHSHQAWDEFKTLPDREVLPPAALVEALWKFRGCNVVSRKLHDLFIRSGLTQCAYNPNGVDESIFRSIKPIGRNSEKLILGFSGTKKHDFLKGVTEFIEPLAELPFVDLNLAMPQGRHVPLEEMPQFYNELDVYLCASSSEGFSLSVLEASACGRPLVSTRVGGCEDLIHDGENGFFVDRNLDQIRERLKQLHEDRSLLRRMGEANRKAVEENWTWKKRTQDWFAFMDQS